MTNYNTEFNEIIHFLMVNHEVHLAINENFKTSNEKDFISQNTQAIKDLAEYSFQDILSSVEDFNGDNDDKDFFSNLVNKFKNNELSKIQFVNEVYDYIYEHSEDPFFDYRMKEDLGESSINDNFDTLLEILSSPRKFLKGYSDLRNERIENGYEDDYLYP